MESPADPPHASVYQRRRALALGAGGVALVLGVWTLGALADSDNPRAGTRGAIAQPSKRPSGLPSSGLPSSSRPLTSSGSPAPSAALSVASDSKAVPTSSTATEQSVGKSQTDVLVSSLPPPATQPSPLPVPDPPAPCTDNVLRLTAEVGQQEYQVGQRPALRLVVANAGPVACTRDIGRELRELVVVSADGATREWSSNDCYSMHPPAEVRTLVPGNPMSFGVTWAGRTSDAGCPRKRNTVPSGDYLLLAKLGDLVSAPTPFRLVD